MKYSVLTVGDELCIGQVVNTNAAFIANLMSGLGFSVFCHSTIPDEPSIMKSELQRLMDNSEIVIITGGLGPTHDDITKGVLVDFFGGQLVVDTNTLSYLESWFESRDRKITEVGIAQAMIPSKSRALNNRVGTAPGILFEFDNKLILALPGVPAEMRYIVTNEFLPIAKNHFEKFSTEVQQFLTIKTVGIFESSLAELIGGPENFPIGTTLAYLPSAGSVRLRIGAIAASMEKASELIDEMKNTIISKAGKYIIAYGDDSIQSVLGNILKSNGLTVSVAESCTGGMLGAAFTDNSGSSAYFKGGLIAYSNDVKIEQLKVSKATIDTFGAVSEQTAIEMARNISTLFDTDFGLSITGIAGPDGGTTEKPVGTVWIGVADRLSAKAFQYKFGNDRSLNRERAVSKALELLIKKVNEK
jgi:nicotinamide-nucleotide amidase